MTARQTGSDIVVTVCDRGPGFILTAPEAGRGLGLGGLRDRVEAMGGRFAIASRPEGGTCLTVELSVSTSVKEKAHA